MIPLAQLFRDLNLFVQGVVPADAAIDAVTDDSRRAGPGSLFVAIEGARADGHTFLAQAAERGCRVALVRRRDVSPPPGMTLLSSKIPAARWP